MARWRATAEIPATTQGPALARRVVATLLEGWGLGDLSADAQLVASELVTNAVQHAPGSGSFQLRLSVQTGLLRVALTDGSPIRPVVAEFNGASPRGRGMRLVQALALGWGVEDQRGGKRVWAEFVTDARPRSTPDRPDREAWRPATA